MTETGMYLYPWAIDGSLEAFRLAYRELGCTAMAPSLSYHRGDILLARGGRMVRLDKSAVYFSPMHSLYGRLVPEAHRETAERGTMAGLRELCLREGWQFSGWVVLLHNSSLGEAHPGACVLNAMGDRLSHTLCPAHPDVLHYAEALIEDVCAQFSPDSLMLESATPRPAPHGGHHDIANVRMGTAAVWLLSLCFCPHCLEKAGRESGMDAEKARETCRIVLRRLLNRETDIPGADSTQIASLLLEYPELYAYQLQRQQRAAELIARIGAIMRRHGVAFRLIPSSAPYEILGSFLEAVGFRQCAGLVDALVPLVYGAGESYSLVRNNIRLLDADTPVGMGMTLHPGRFAAKGDFLAAVASAAAERPHCAFFYNYSLASDERLTWIRDAAKLLRGE